ncbi:MAG: DUF2970 domain-containing protein [Candidimonas sp.]|nr:MAG: DUF2970 domain-containing protein [Candidimonas sp.]
MNDDTQSPEEEEQHPSFLQTLKAVSWGFFGVRKRRDQEKDARGTSPGYLIVIGLLLAAVFVLVLVVVANLAAGSLQ